MAGHNIIAVAETLLENFIIFCPPEPFLGTVLLL